MDMKFHSRRKCRSHDPIDIQRNIVPLISLVFMYNLGLNIIQVLYTFQHSHKPDSPGSAYKSYSASAQSMMVASYNQ